MDMRVCICVCVCLSVCIVADDTKWRRSCNRIWQGVDHKKATSTEHMDVMMDHRSDIVHSNNNKCNAPNRKCNGLRPDIQTGKNVQGLGRSANSRNSNWHDCNTDWASM